MAVFDDLDSEGKESLQREFDAMSTSHERRVEIITLVKDGAQEAQMGPLCPNCKNYPFFIPHDEALIEGHVYSRDGLAELRITGYCEFCFDLITIEPDEEEQEDER